MKLSSIALLSGVAAAQSTNSTLPIVDLGYNIQQASTFNETAGYYNFSNIRYAAPPVGDLRFAAPQAPANDRSVLQTGQQNRVCPQAAPSWIGGTSTFLAQYIAGKRNFSNSDFPPIPPPPTTLPAQPAGVPEDCLFLDVFAPTSVFENRKSSKVPVLVWIYGGGYTAGSKASGSPAGLLARSQDNGGDGVIFVALNYRLGAYGWLAGPNFQNEGGIENAGLYDQRFALEWVQKYIHLFGGDCEKVTVFGESAGGGSIMHQLTAFGGTQPVPFQQIIPQSPGFSPVISAHQRDGVYQRTLKAANVTSLAALRALPYPNLQLANLQVVAASPYGQFNFGPTVDGVFAPSLPGQLLARGQYAKNIKVMVGQNTNEGLLFTNPRVENDANDTLQRQNLITALPTLAGLPDQLDFIANTLYPQIFDGSQAAGYTDRIGRSAAATSELAFICNTFYMDKAFGNQTYSYQFAVPPALHGSDVPYTFYSGTGQTTGSLNATVAMALQQYITSFAMDGDPNEPGVPVFNLYGDDAQVNVLNITGFREGADPAANRRCDYWQSALWS